MRDTDQIAIIKKMRDYKFRIMKLRVLQVPDKNVWQEVDYSYMLSVVSSFQPAKFYGQKLENSETVYFHLFHNFP